MVRLVHVIRSVLFVEKKYTRIKALRNGANVLQSSESTNLCSLFSLRNKQEKELLTLNNAYTDVY